MHRARLCVRGNAGAGSKHLLFQFRGRGQSPYTAHARARNNWDATAGVVAVPCIVAAVPTAIEAHGSRCAQRNDCARLLRAFLRAGRHSFSSERTNVSASRRMLGKWQNARMQRQLKRTRRSRAPPLPLCSGLLSCLGTTREREREEERVRIYWRPS